MAPDAPTILFAGGGTGGHLFPGLAVAERVRERGGATGVHFACSGRPLDARLLREAGQPFTPLSVRPLPRRPWHVPAFLRHYGASKRAAAELIRLHRVGAVVAMGGFVSAPPVAAARKLGVPVMLVNLDAVPGIANRYLAHRCDRLFSVYDAPRLSEGGVGRIGMPVRRACLGPEDAAEARRALGLDPARPVLLVTGASQGAESINRAMIELARQPAFAEVTAGWTVLHLAGAEDRAAAVEAAYERAGVEARVVSFSNQMGLAWGAAELAISRAGAGSVAEAALNAVPTIFLPYPHHRDQHQKHNAAPLADGGGALLIEDAVDGPTNADRLLGPLLDLMRQWRRRESMRSALRALGRTNGADRLAEAALELLGR